MATSSFKETLLTGLAPCSSSPCRNGTCMESDGSYTCNCSSGFYGINCDKVSDPCTPSPCQNSGTCHILSLSEYHCTCLSGWTGTNCDQDIQECSQPEDVCQEGVCVEESGYYRCRCFSGYAGKNCDKSCKETRIDLAFMIEGSASLNQWGENNFQKIVNIVQDVAKYFNDSDSNIGIVLYATEAELKANFSFRPVQINDVLDNLVYPSGWTRIGQGLNFTREELFVDSRANTHRVLVVFMDGTSIDYVFTTSKLLRDVNVTIMAVTLGDWYDVKQVGYIASDPDSKTTLLTRYDELDGLSFRLRDMICEAVDHCFSNPCSHNRPCINLLDDYQCDCGANFAGRNCEVDIDECSSKSPCINGTQICVNFPATHFCNCRPGNFDIQNSCNEDYSVIFNIGFIIYTGESIDRYRKGNFATQIAFAKGLSKTFNVTSKDTNVGIITYSGDAAVKYRFENITNQAELEDALDSLTISGSGRNIGEALHLACTDLFNQSNEERNNVQNILIVIADGGADDNISVPSDALKEDGVVTFSVGIDGYVFSQLNEIASDPDSDHVFTIDYYDGLGPIMATLKDAIIREVEPCATKPCANNGTCFNLPGGEFNCTCTPDWTGKHCETQVEPCALKPCANNGSCLNLPGGGFNCTCSANWTGERCETQVEPCASKPCATLSTNKARALISGEGVSLLAPVLIHSALLINGN